jgi:uncharacterized protein YneF (UPF0154 family)
MSKNTKIVLIVVVIVALCICVCAGGYIALQTTGKFLGESLVDNPEEAQSLAQSMLDYDRPAGYQEEGAVDFGFMKMVMIVDSSGSGPLIMMAEMPSGMGIDEDQMRQQIEQSMQRSMGNRNFSVELVDEQVRTIRGADVTFFIYTGTDSSGTQVKQVVSELFEGKNGLIMLMIMGNEIGWNQAEIDAFLDSVR